MANTHIWQFWNIKVTNLTPGFYWGDGLALYQMHNFYTLQTLKAIR